jgi:hypothetical protein
MKRAATNSGSRRTGFSNVSGVADLSMETVNPDPDAMTSLLASELNQLSLQERQKVYEDLHGIQDIEEECPETLSRKIAQFQEEVKKARDKSAYDKASFLSPTHVNDPYFCLMFLRAEDHDVRAASKRMILYFKHKLELFGIEKLAKKITFEDLDQDDRAAMMTGAVQTLPDKDRSGRHVCVIFSHLLKYKTVMNQVSVDLLW